MNLLLFEASELDADQLSLTDHRAKHIRSVLKLKIGDTLRVGMLNSKMGQARVVQMDSSVVKLEVVLDREPPPRPELELILALPRPIMLQRILKQATVLGVRRFHLIRSAKVEKSFFQTPVLEPEKIKGFLVEGLAQAVDTRLPEVLVHHRFKPFVQDVVPTLTGHGLLAHPDIGATLPEVFPGRAKQEKILLAIGPEG
ncbi:MAG: 16S rRNA (uracil(1498)-N(3))-methyltransferase, partial [Candidatus Electrothrix sp. ATG1]|nr:16S rRNA (uracil(1498)-N(3))-methyltransferase [Candidatus Electrothrix sp. ATG1]